MGSLPARLGGRPNSADSSVTTSPSPTRPRNRPFSPASSPSGMGNRAADGVAAPARLPIPDGLDAGENGRLRGRVGDDGMVTELSVLFGLPPSRAGSDPTPVTYRLAVTDRGSTVVERPDAEETLGWYRELKNESPVPEDAARVERPDW